jgi:hypothetical protein
LSWSSHLLLRKNEPVVSVNLGFGSILDTGERICCADFAKCQEEFARCCGGTRSAGALTLLRKRKPIHPCDPCHPWFLILSFLGHSYAVIRSTYLYGKWSTRLRPRWRRTSGLRRRCGARRLRMRSRVGPLFLTARTGFALGYGQARCALTLTLPVVLGRTSQGTQYSVNHAHGNCRVLKDFRDRLTTNRHQSTRIGWDR